MSRYKKIITGEIELPEVSGIKFLIYPTIDTRIDMLEHIKSTQLIEEVDEKNDEGKTITKRIKGKFFSLSSIAKTCAKIIYEGCYEHDGKGRRVKKKEEEQDTTEEQILSLVLESDIMSIYLEVLKALDIISKDKADELKKGQGEIEKN
jgi:hypothetical protein